MNMHIKQYIILSICVLAKPCALTVAGSIIKNGSFETPIQASDGYFATTPEYWIGGCFILRNTSGTTHWYNGGSWPAPQEGSQYEDFGHYGPAAWQFSQQFTINTAGQYILLWYDNAAVTCAHAYTVAVTGNNSVTFTGVGSLTWTARSLSLTLAAGNNTLTFTGAGTSFDSLLDNVSISPVSIPVPEPSTYLAGLGALGLLGLFAKFNRK